MPGSDLKSLDERDAILALLQTGAGLEFPQAVRLLQALHPEAVKVGGGSGGATDEPVRFRANANFGFPTAEVESIEPLTDDATTERGPRYRMTVNFLGLYGPTSPLPMPINERVIAEERDVIVDEERAVRPFLDLFNHRLTSLFYHCWRKYRYYERYRRGASDDF